MRSRMSWPAVLLSCALVAPAAAQEMRGTITGTITDQQGATIPRATVKIVNVATNLTTTAASNESGIYVAPFIAAGGYTVTASAQGFKNALRGAVEVRVGGRLQISP